MKRKLTLIIEKTDGNYSAYCPEIPGCIATGANEEEAYNNMVEALKFHIEGMKLENIPLDVAEVSIRETVI